MKKDINRNRKDKNLAGLYVILNEFTYGKDSHYKQYFKRYF